MSSGIYSNSFFVKHSDGRTFEYYLNVNPIGNDDVSFCRKEVGVNKPADYLHSDECKGGVIVDEDGNPLEYDGGEVY